jgi:hypothetical protein
VALRWLVIEKRTTVPARAQATIAHVVERALGTGTRQRLTKIPH